MATKKQRRAAAEAKHEAMMAEYKRTGLEAQRRDRERRAAQARRIEEDKERDRRRKSAFKAISDMRREDIERADEALLEAQSDDSIDLTRKDEIA